MTNKLCTSQLYNYIIVVCVRLSLQGIRVYYIRGNKRIIRGVRRRNDAQVYDNISLLAENDKILEETLAEMSRTLQNYNMRINKDSGSRMYQYNEEVLDSISVLWKELTNGSILKTKIKNEESNQRIKDRISKQVSKDRISKDRIRIAFLRRDILKIYQEAYYKN